MSEATNAPGPAPTDIQEQVELAIARNPEVVANTIYPYMGPLIRGTVTDALDGMLRSFNETLRYSLSFRGLLWRIEALRTGRSFSDVVLSKTMEFRVEQVFLIHGATGLMLQHVTDLETQQDPMMISGMLTAIQDFVHSSLGSGKGEALNTLNVGDTTILIERGPYCFLAAVVRGTPPSNLRPHLANAVAETHRLLGPVLEKFDGDTTPIEPCKPIVEKCLVKELKDVEKKFPWRLALGWAIVLVLVGRVTFVNIRDGIYWRQYLERLSHQRGIVVVTAKKEDGKFHVWGLRDSYAADPISILKQGKLDMEKVEWRWEPYHSTLPEFVLHRNIAEVVIRFPEGVSDVPANEIAAVETAALNIVKFASHLSKAGQYPEITVYGHTNYLEDGNAARELSQARADNVVALLNERGLESLKIEASGIGYQRPVLKDAETPFQKSYNESVSFRVKVRSYEGASGLVHETDGEGGTE